MEYLLVKFPESRGVKIDGKPSGVTNVTLEVEAGAHTVTLEPPNDFTPETQDVEVKDTTVIDPKRVEFFKKTPIAGQVGTGSVEPPKPKQPTQDGE